MERAAVQFHAQAPKVVDSSEGDAFATRLVDRSRARLDDDYGQAGEGGADRGGRTSRAGAGDEEVDHFVSAESNAASSARIRTVSNGMFSSRNTTAVTHAVWTSGNAIPSATTAT
ncbi:MAG: hypothetical protein QOH03_603 [Kribbellaceae bacterium]|nr:hypothetical protein [Kribbellaceae bacterium]